MIKLLEDIKEKSERKAYCRKKRDSQCIQVGILHPARYAGRNVYIVTTGEFTELHKRTQSLEALKTIFQGCS